MNEVSDLRGALNEHLQQCAGSNARMEAELQSLKGQVRQLQSAIIWATGAVIVALIGAIGAMFALLLRMKGLG